MLVALVAVLALVLGSCSNRDDTDGGEVTAADRSREVSVMTRNLYLGADLNPLFEAEADGLGAALQAVFDQVQASDIPARLDIIAKEIVDTRPDLVALQEATLWRVQAPGANESTELYDFVEILLGRLAARGATYEVAASADGFSGGMPVAGVGLVSMQDRDVILVRADSSVSTSAPKTGTFPTKLQLDIAGVPIEVVRGWASVEATAGGERMRFVATHLEAFDDGIRDRQQKELLAELDASDLPTMLLGDLNSSAGGDDSATYDATLAAGFADAWSTIRPEVTGRTCCRTSDLTRGELSERIDFVLYRGDFDVIAAEVVGAETISRTPTGKWASDHAGVQATVRIPIAR